jgi:hypothetical protein
MGIPPDARGLLAGAALLVLAAPLAAQQTTETPGAAQPPADDPNHAVEFALSGDGLWFAYRNGLHRAAGNWGVGLFASEDDDFALEARLMRSGQPKAETPLGVGIGLGVFGAALDDTDDEVAAILISGAADFALDRVMHLMYPIRVGVEASYAPDVATFMDGDGVLDVRGFLEADLSSWATAYAGYRLFEVDLEDGGEDELDTSFHVGVRLGF